MSDRRRVRVRIGGRVQGVFFRVSCAREARARGVTGWVRNLPGGDVEAVFEGDAGEVEEMMAWCHRGPAGADVIRLGVSEEPTEGTERFDIVG